MPKQIYYRQCRMQNGTSHQTSWIPEEFAVIGQILKLRSEGIWKNGWVVNEISSHRLEESQLPDSHKIIKDHRKATGDSLPKGV